MKKLIKAVIGIGIIVTLVVGYEIMSDSDNYGEKSAYVMKPVTDGKYVQTQLGRLFVKEIGTGEATIVLWPSIFTDHKIYDGLTRELSGKYRFLLVDGPGHGRSEGPESEFNMGDSADAMTAVLDHYNLEKAIIGGTSWGGMTAAELSLQHPERVQALILMNTPVEIDENNPGIMARFISFGARHGLGFSFFRNGTASSFFSSEIMHNNHEYSEAFHAMLKGANARQLSAAVRSVVLGGTPLKERMAEISAPTLMIAGKEDEMYPIDVQREAAKLLPQGEFAVVDGKHISVVEQPRLVAKLIGEFVQHLTDQQ